MKFRLMLNSMKIWGSLFFSRFGFLPDYKAKIHTVLGKKIVLPRIENPSKEDVDKYHAIYIEAVKSLFERYKEKYAEGLELKIY